MDTAIHLSYNHAGPERQMQYLKHNVLRLKYFIRRAFSSPLPTLHTSNCTSRHNELLPAKSNFEFQHTLAILHVSNLFGFSPSKTNSWVVESSIKYFSSQRMLFFKLSKPGNTISLFSRQIQCCEN